MRRVPAALASVLWTSLAALAASSPIDPPGFRPRPPDYHALTGARLVPRPGVVLTNAVLVVRQGLIEAVLTDPNQRPPAGARVWTLSGHTVYAGFIEPYLVQSQKRPVATDAIEPGADQELAAGADARAADVAPAPRFFGVAGQEPDPGTPGAGAGSALVTPERRLAEQAGPDAKTRESLRELGFTAAHLVPGRGLVRGQSAVFTLGDTSPNAALLRADVAQCVAFDAGPIPTGDDNSAPAPQAYPASLMGAIALIRQTFFDADHQVADRAHAGQHAGSRPRPPFNAALDALQAVRRGQAVFVEPGSVLMLDRAARLASELGWQNRVFVASGHEWRRPDLAAATRGPLVVPVSFPALPKFPDESGWDGVALDLLRHWDWAPENPAVLRRHGIEMALTTHGLGERKEFRTQLRAALDRGLVEDDALAALTTIPARLLGVADRIGTLEPGRVANLTVVAGSYFEPDHPVSMVWIDGQPYLSPPRAPKTASGSNAVARASTPVAASVPDSAAARRREIARQRVARSPLDDRGPIAQPPAVLVRGATIWTCSSRGILRDATLLASDGRIVAIGPETGPVPSDALVVDGRGLHVTPGLIDCHSHSMILGQVNEATLPSTAMVRIGDVVNSETPNIAWQLAGGLTVANLLHGSANPIGGQNAVIKLRDGAGPEDLKFAAAPAGIKFALGENVKQSNWGERHTTRFPQSRMGVQTFYVNRFTAARQYAVARAAAAATPGSDPIRRDLELEALAEILAGTRLIHCHSYRQDEIVAFLRTMESFGIRVATLQHILEGYKVADEIARHGAGASAFSDWWAFKYEVIDAIPYAGSLLHARGVNVSFNSDSNDLARRLNTEAAKAVKYGGTPPEDALRFVTLNPARQLGIDGRVGSLEPGKDADFVLWSGDPLDTRSIALQTWIDGRQYFERNEALARARRLADEREALLAKARQLTAPGVPEAAPAEAARARFFQAALERARHLGVAECLDCQLPRLDQP